jgi:hypothetical protein
MLFFRAVIRLRRAPVIHNRRSSRAGTPFLRPIKRFAWKTRAVTARIGRCAAAGIRAQPAIRLPAPRIAAFLTVAEVCVHS